MQKQSKQKWFINQLLDSINEIGFKKLKITRSAYSLLIALAKYADKKGFCWPLTSQLKNDTGICSTNQWRYLKILKERKFLTIKRQYDRRNRMTRNYYTIDLNAILTISMGVEGDLRVDAIEVQRPCSNIEPNVNLTFDRTVNLTGATIKTTHTAKLPTKTDLDIVQANRLDDSDSNGIFEMTGDYYFEEFWSNYPRKEKKKDARNAWIRLKLDKVGKNIIADVMVRRVRHIPWLEGKSFIPLPTSYLNGERWEDEIIGEQNGHPKTSNVSIRSSKTSEGILRGFDEYEAAERKRRGIS